MTAGQFLLAGAVGHQAAVAKASKVRGHDLEEEAAQELRSWQVYGFGAPPSGVVFREKADSPLAAEAQPPMRDGHAVDVAAEVLQPLLWPAPGRFGLDPPRALLQLPEAGRPRLGLGQGGALAREVEPVLSP